MIDLVLVIIIIISLFKPEVLLNKKIKEKTNEEQKTILVKNSRKIYSISVATIESLAIMRYNENVGLILAVILLVLELVIAVPAAKENSKIKKELKQ